MENPAISVIIPMYNAEKYIDECLNSLFEQTFQNFEVIIVDDCSTDNSVKIVKNYKEKFGERLKLTKTEKNSGGCAVPRNVGFPLARGEYVFFMDADDILTKTGFAEMYVLAKNFDADVVYCEKYYMSEGVGQEFKNNIRVANARIQAPPFVDKPTLETTDLAERIKKLMKWNYWMTAWLKLVKRDLFINNGIMFPETFISEDDIWSMKLLFTSKRFLRIPNICYIRRMRKDSIMGVSRTTSDLVQRWMDVVIRNIKDLDNFMGRIDFFKENPRYRYDIIARSVRIAFNNIFERCINESAFDVYKIFQEKFGKYLGDNDVLVSSICSYVVNQQRELLNYKKRSEQVEQKQIAAPEAKALPGISIVIPMYNVEKYIGELLYSLLHQTFQNFEVIIVDDRSTDNSFEIVNSYVPKFNGRLKLIQLEKNSGGAGEPRNVGLTLTRGEYVIFFDADDFVLLNALETLYTAAKKYDADVVYTSAYYNLVKPNDIHFYSDGLSKTLRKKGLKDEPTLVVDDQKKILNQLLISDEPEGNFGQPWSRLVRRELLIQNKIVFPIVPNCDDFIWVINVYSYSKRFLRIPFPFYFYRRHTESLSLAVRDPEEQLAYWVSSYVAWAKALNALESRTEILKNNPEYCRRASTSHFNYVLVRTKEPQKILSNSAIYEILHRELGKENKSFEVVLSLFFATIDAKGKLAQENSQANERLLRFLTSRIDIQLVPKTGGGDFQILSMSDDKATITKPPWINKNGIGYVINSYKGTLKFIAKPIATDGQIRLELRGLDVRTPKDNSKRIPYWVNYTNLTVNGKNIFNQLTPAWHDKSYRYNIDAKAGEEITIQIDWLSDTPPNMIAPRQITPPAISVIIPMYNAEEYIGECLDSLLLQTFQDFEVIIVDDCSTDNSVAIVNSYMPKFNKRLTLTKTKKNSGSGGYVPRNIGLKLAKGEYIYFVDADDFILGSALKTLYSAAKEYNAEVVHTAAHYVLKSPTDVIKLRDGLGRKLLEEKNKDDITLVVNEPDKNLRELVFKRGFTTPWAKFIRRDFLIENKIFFPEILKAGDYIWTLNVYCNAKRFLRFPIPVYFYRIYNAKSISRTKRPLPEQISYWVSALLEWLKALNELANRTEILQKNLTYCYEISKRELAWCLNCLTEERKESTSRDIYEILYRELSQKTDLFGLMIPFFFSAIDAKDKVNKEQENLLHQFRPTARLDVKFFPKIIENGDFKIVSMSDDEAETTKPQWLNKGGIGYQIQSYAGKLEIVFKATADGHIRFDLKGLDIRDQKDNSKRIPFWLDYTKLTVNGKTILDKLTPAWHNKPYRYEINVNANEEITMQVEWFPHRGDSLPLTPKPVKKDEPVVDKILPHKADVLPAVSKPAEQSVVDKVPPNKADVLPAVSKPAEQSVVDKILPNKADVLPVASKPAEQSVVDKFLPELTGRMDIQMLPTTGTGDFKILSVSDDEARTTKPDYLNKDGVGYQIQSYAGKMELIAKATADGQITLKLKGMDIPDPKDKSKRIPYWIDYAKLTINGKTILDKLTPAWHDKPYRYDMNVKADEIIIVQVEWLPHKEVPEKPKSVEQPVVDKFLPELTGRVDIQMVSKTGMGDFKILSVSDEEARTTKPDYLNKDAIGYQIQSYAGKMEFIGKATADGQITLKLKGMDIRNPKDKSKRVPYWIDYTKLTINGKTILDKLTPAWHDKPYRYDMNVKAGAVIIAQLEWLPHKEVPEEPKPAEQPVIDKFLPELTGRLDLQMVSDTDNGDLKIIYMSDDKAKTAKPDYLNKDGVGYQIQSYAGKMEFIAKATADGQVSLKLKGMDIPEPNDKSKRVPYWIDYTKLTVNGETILDKLTPTWHDKPYSYDIALKANEVIVVQVEWLPHKDDT